MRTDKLCGKIGERERERERVWRESGKRKSKIQRLLKQLIHD